MREREMFGSSIWWGSVRKVRYLSDIEASARFAIENGGKDFSEDMLRRYIFDGRQDRLRLIHKHYKSVFYTPIDPVTNLKTRSLKVTLPDTLAFLKNIGILEIRNGKTVPLPLAHYIQQTRERSQRSFALAKAILCSRYLAYRYLLLWLTGRKALVVPKSLRRTRQLRYFLIDKGIYTDVASFYTMRDLFYELEVVNWYMDAEGNLTVYPTAILGHDDSKTWTYSLSIEGHRFLYRKIVSQEHFIKSLERNYLRQTDERFNIEAELLSVRDGVCNDLGISDQQFKEMIKEVAESSKILRIILSFGTVYKKKRNYGLKIETLPKVSSDRLALYIRLKRRDRD